jgi:glycosyltransferase involved in cell wall biosynthesis
MKKLTILITNYNYGRYLSRCIRSCVCQTMSKEEYDIVIVDDKSTDSSRNILENWDGEYNIRVIYNEKNLGLGESCRLGVSKCITPYVVRVDADDYVSEDFCKTLYIYASLNKSHAVACDYYEVDINENIIGRFSGAEKPIACGILFKTSSLEYVGGYSNLRINEDVDLRTRFDKEFRVDFLNIPMYRYFKHEESLTKKGV